MAEAGVERQGTTGAQEGKLQPGLKRRHMTIISLGGIIGAGLFVGTLGVMLVAYVLRKQFGPPQRDPSEVIRESETRRASEAGS